MVAADRSFHQFLYELSGNPLAAPAMAVHWSHAERVMGEVLPGDEKPRDICDQHAAMLDAIAAGDAVAPRRWRARTSRRPRPS